MNRTIDPLETVMAYAPSTPVDAEGLVAARARVEREIASVPHTRGALRPVTSSPNQPWRRPRWVATTAAVGGLAVLGVLAQGLSSPEAFASWTASPTVLSGPDARRAGEQCIEQMSQGPEGPGWPSDEEFDEFTTLLSERRGDWTFSLVGDGTWVASCFVDGESAGGRIRQFESATVPPDHVELESISGTVGDDYAYSYTYGRVGSDVRAVDITLVTGEVVEASVVDGLYSAWWPLHPRNDATVTATLADGTTRGPFPIESIASRNDD